MVFVFLFHRAAILAAGIFILAIGHFTKRPSRYFLFEIPTYQTCPIFKHFLFIFPPFALLYTFYCFFLNVNSCETADGSRWRMLEARLQAYTSDLQRLPLKRDIHN